MRKQPKADSEWAGLNKHIKICYDTVTRGCEKEL